MLPLVLVRLPTLPLLGDAIGDVRGFDRPLAWILATLGALPFPGPSAEAGATTGDWLREVGDGDERPDPDPIALDSRKPGCARMLVGMAVLSTAPAPRPRSRPCSPCTICSSLLSRLPMARVERLVERLLATCLSASALFGIAAGAT